MAWGAPDYAWLLLLLVPTKILLTWANRRRNSDFARVSGGMQGLLPASALPSHWRRQALLTTAAGLAILALCRPQWGTEPVKQSSRGPDILIALDVSRSMLADDMIPNRLEAAKLSIMSLLTKLQGQRVGIIAFAGTAFMTCPLTTDYETAANVLRQTDATTIPLGGTSLAGALREAQRAFGERPQPGSVLIVISDGENHDDADTTAAQALASAGVVIHAVSVGTRSGGLIPLANGQFLKRADGTIVKSRLQVEPLRAITAHAAGREVNLSDHPDALMNLIADSGIGKPWLDSQTRELQFRDRFQIPLALALLLLLLEPLLVAGSRR